MAYEDEHYIETARPVWNYSLINNEIIEKFQQGELYEAYQFFGAHSRTLLQTTGFQFTVWAPHAASVAVSGDFNQWDTNSHILFPRLDRSGIWEGFIPHVSEGCHYKFGITGQDGVLRLKADPYAFRAEVRPATASVTHIPDYRWKDGRWMKRRKKNNALNAPWSVYEMHLGSWMRPPEGGMHTYEQTADLLIPYLQDMGFTHVEFMPVMEHPFDDSWGYQCTGYFAPTSRYGPPESFMYLVDRLHQEGIGVILDWVPSHFPGDQHGLYLFDGAHTYEYADMRKGFHPDWNSYIFNYRRGEVRSFLISSAHFWMDRYHADGLRVDAVNSIIRLDFSRKPGEWEPNAYGGRENIEAIDFLKRMNEILYRSFPDTHTIAEEASDWPGITLPTHLGGFGFGMKWMMGWMHDTFRYFKTPPTQRPSIQDTLSFSMMYFYDEQFMLPLSHDEVVHGKSPMLYKMPGEEHEKFANLRLLYGYMFAHPGAKLLFMGNEFGQSREWDHHRELDWHLLSHVSHRKLKDCVRTLCHLYRKEPALHERCFDPLGFEWVQLDRREDGVVAFRRKGNRKKDDILVVMNTSARSYHGYGIPVYGKSSWRELLNTDSVEYWGTGKHLNPSISLILTHKKTHRGEIKLNLPALSILMFR